MDSLSHLHERRKWSGPNGAQGNPTKGTERPKYVHTAYLPVPAFTCSLTDDDFVYLFAYLCMLAFFLALSSSF